MLRRLFLFMTVVMLVAGGCSQGEVAGIDETAKPTTVATTTASTTTTSTTTTTALAFDTTSATTVTTVPLSGIARFSLGNDQPISWPTLAPDGSVWTIFDKGAAHFDGSTWTTFTTDDGLATDKIAAMDVGPDGTVWALHTDATGLSVFDGTAWQRVDGWEPVVGDISRVRAIAAAPDGSLWAVGSGGLAHFDGTTWTTHAKTFPDMRMILTVGTDSSVWVTSAFDYGRDIVERLEVHRFDGETWTTYEMPTEDLPAGVTVARTDDPTDIEAAGFPDMDVHPDGALWLTLMGTVGHGSSRFAQGVTVIRFDSETWTVFDAVDTFDEGLPYVIAIADDGTVWVGSPGVWRAVDNDFTHSANVTLTGGGLYRYDEVSWERVLDEMVLHVTAGRTDSVWAEVGPQRTLIRWTP